MKTIISVGFLVVLLHFITLPHLQAQTEAWERINPLPVEASLYDCSLLPNNRIVAVGSNATVIYSDNFGTDWEIIYTPDNIFRRIDFNSVDFADESLGMAVGNYYSIIKTDDGGVSWQDISPGANLPYFVYKDICFSDPGNCYVVGVHYANNFLLHSSDEGNSWDTAFQSSAEIFNQVQFVDENTGFLSGGGGNYFFKCIDGGQNWQLIEVDPGIEELRVGPIYFTGRDTGFIDGAVGGTDWYSILLKTVDGGLSWHEVITDYWGGRFFFINQDTGFTIGGAPWYSNLVSKTTDGGESWELISDIIGDWFFNSICMNTEGKGLIVGDAGQIYNSDDFGNNWGPAFTNPYQKYEMDKAFITGDSTILANLWGGGGGVTDFKAIQSNDRGASWTEAPFEDGISAICFVNDSIAFYGSYYNPISGGIYKSVDGGNSWDFYDLGDEEFHALSIDFIDDQTGFAGSLIDYFGMEMYKTTDQGASWIRQNFVAFNYVNLFYQLEFKDDSVGFIVGDIGNNNSGSNIIVSYDRGNTWEIDTLPFIYDFKGVYFLNPDTGFLYGYQNLVKTINGGKDWFPVTVNPEDHLDFVSMSFPTSLTGYVINGSEISNRSIFKTVDGGETWNSIDPPTSSYILSVNFFTEDEGVIVGENAIIFKTQTGGMVGIPDPGISPNPESLWKCYPNPFSSGTIISSLKDINNSIVIRIYDFTGRPVRSYSGSSSIAGETFFYWDGTDDFGNKVPSGIYIIRIDYSSARELMKVIKF
jgi:photosystem II stability/assembly factor-like uncharacterized protein